MNLIDVTKQFATDEKCLDYLEQMRWPDGVRCVTCGSKEISRITRKSTKENKRTRLYQCLEKTCNQQFTVTAGTIFHDSHLPLTKWFLGVAIVLNAKKGVSALQLQRDLGLGSYRTAWYLYHRIREAMQENTLLTGTVEMDETFVGGKMKGRAPIHRYDNKDTVIGMKQRKGHLRLVHTPNRKYDTLRIVAVKHISPEVENIYTDDFVSYPWAFKSTEFEGKHNTVNHSAKEYVRGDVHTNSIESAFSLFKRGVIGSYHQLSIKHLQRYLNEFSHRFNRREIANAFEETIQRLTGFGNIPYKKLTAKA